MTCRMELEIAVQDVAGARIAAQVGADRVELCTALASTGGLTPSAGTVAAVAEALTGTGTTVHVLIRPRSGGFVYEADELAVQVGDVRAVLDAGADGVVVGTLTPTGIDEVALAALADAAAGADLTFHRAFDVLRDREAALTVLGAAGVRRVLTSGGAASALEGIAELARLAPPARAAGIELMAGGGVTADAVPALATAGVAAAHLSARRHVSEAGGPGGGADGYDVTDLGLAEAAAAAVRALR